MDTDLHFWVEALQKNDSDESFEQAKDQSQQLGINDIGGKEHSLILTANQRQTRYLAELFDTADFPLIRPVITTYPHWLSNLWCQLQDQAHPLANRTLSNPTQERYMWQQVIDNSPNTPPLIDANSLCKYLQDAYRIMISFQIPKELLSQNSAYGTDDEETQFLINCIQDYENLLNALEFCSAEQLPNAILQAFESSSISVFEGIYLYGFAEIPPEMRALLSHVSKKQFELGLSVPPTSMTEPVDKVCYRFDDTETEFNAASRWAYEKANAYPNSRIAIVAPNLTSIKPQLESTLLKTFDPDYFLSNERFETNKFFDISASEPLINIPIIDAIFTVMKLREPLLDKESCRKICTSVFLGHHNVEVGSSLLSWINSYSSPKVPSELLNKQWAYFESKLFINEIETKAKKSSPTEQNDFFDLNSNFDKLEDSHYRTTDKNVEQHIEPQNSYAKKLSEFREHLRLVKPKNKTTANFTKNPAYKSFNDWLDWLLANLKDLGWPGRRVLNTYEYQQLQSFFSAIEALRTLDLCQTNQSRNQDEQHHDSRTEHKNLTTQSFLKVSLSAFLRELSKVCTNIAFHMQTTDTNVSVLGLMEASALPFDFCWVIGMSDDVLPSAPSPNPFIPLPIQRKYQTPRSTPQREFEYSSAFVSDLESYCTNLVFSYTQNESTGHVKKSPLLEHISDSPAPHPLLCSDVIGQYYESAFDYSDFEIVPTGKAPEIPEGQAVTGGSGHISLYGVNPMFAFLRYRLFAKSGAPESIGYTAIERGQLVHYILEAIYRLHGSKIQIQSWLKSENYDSELETIIQKCLLNIQKSANKSISSSLFKTEKNYQKKQITSFLKLEIERDDFKVLETESTKKLSIAKRHINLRIDRIDEVQDQYSIIFDYKTGSANLNDLQTEPLFDGQLPLYTLVNLAKPVGAVAYAEISKKHIGYLGIGQCASEFNKADKQEKNHVQKDKIFEAHLPGVVDPKTLNRKELPNTWSDTLNWWQEQLTQSVIQISTGHCTYINRNNSKSGYHSDLMFAVRPEEILNTSEFFYQSSSEQTLTFENHIFDED